MKFNKIKLGDVVQELVSGDWGKEAAENAFAIETYCIRGADINKVNQGKYDKLPKRFVKQKHNKSQFLKKEDLIIEISGGSPTQSTGRIAFVSNDLIYEKPIICSNFCRGIRIKSSYDAKYIYYVLQQTYKSGVFFNFEGKTTGIKNLDLDACLENILIPDIDYSLQCQISSVLSVLDSKIILNNELNSEFKAISETLYHYWFEQFDFPNDKGKPYRESGGKMVFNEKLKRNIPKHWDVKALEYFLCESKNGDWGKDSSEGNYNLKVKCIRGTDINGINGRDELKAPTRYILEKNEHKILKANDLIIEISGGSPTQSTGRLACITTEVAERFENPLICSNFCKAASLISENVVCYFTHSWNRAYDNGVFFGFEGKTSGIKNLLFDSLVSHYYLPLPPDDLLERFQEKISVFEKQKQTNLKQNQELASIRDWLSPMLMNGQVTIKDLQGDQKLSLVAQ